MGMEAAFLSDLTVLDLSQYIAGPYCTKMLADLGAEVIKIEKPGTGDGARRLGPFYKDAPDPEKSGTFLFLNTNKNSVTLNLKTTSGLRILEDLVRRADVLVESFRPGTMERLGLGYDHLSQLNPRLIMASISNFGQSGPYRDYKLTDMVAYALGGLMYMSGEPDREPIRLGFPVCLYMAGLGAFMGVVAALHHRDMKNEGQYIDVSILEAAASCDEISLEAFTFKNETRVRAGNRFRGRYPWVVLPCQDGFVSLVCIEQHQWENLVEALGMPELLRESNFKTAQSRAQHADELDALILPWLAERDKEEVYRSAQSHNTPVGCAYDVSELFNSAQYQARDFFVDIEHPETGWLKYPRLPFRTLDFTGNYRRAPLLGEHTGEVLNKRLGYTAAELVRLRESNII